MVFDFEKRCKDFHCVIEPAIARISPTVAIPKPAKMYAINPLATPAPLNVDLGPMDAKLLLLNDVPARFEIEELPKIRIRSVGSANARIANPKAISRKPANNSFLANILTRYLLITQKEL